MKSLNLTPRKNSTSLPDMMERVVGLFARIPNDIIALLGRISVGAIFWFSGQTKVTGLSLSENAIELFREDYKLPFLDPVVAATLAAIAEHVFPVLLIVGLATRLSAAALLGMTIVIQLFVYPGAWPTHGVWATVLLLIMARGPGIISLDNLIKTWRAR